MASSRTWQRCVACGGRRRARSLRAALEDAALALAKVNSSVDGKRDANCHVDETDEDLSAGGFGGCAENCPTDRSPASGSQRAPTERTGGAAKAGTGPGKERRARWSERILDECFRSILENRPDLKPNALNRTRELMTQAVPDCIVTGFDALVEVPRDRKPYEQSK